MRNYKIDPEFLCQDVLIRLSRNFFRSIEETFTSYHSGCARNIEFFTVSCCVNYILKILSCHLKTNECSLSVFSSA